MMVKTVRASTVKLFGCITLAVLICFSLAVFLPEQPLTYAYADGEKTVYTDAETNEGRISFLRSFGWEVQPDAIAVAKVTVPSEFDTVFRGYNELQKLQGLDLSRYKQKEVTRYTYLITNYDGYDGKVFANLIVYRGCVVGGDVCTEDSRGFIHGFLKSTHL